MIFLAMLALGALLGFVGAGGAGVTIGTFVKRLRHRPLTPGSWVRIP